MRSRWPPLLVLAALLVPLVAASGAVPPDAAARVPIGGTTLAHWAGGPASPEDADNGTVNEVARGSGGVLWFGVNIDPTRGKNQSMRILVESADLGLSNVTLTLVLDSNVSNQWAYANASFLTTNATPENASYSFNATLEQATENGTLALESVEGQGFVTVTSEGIAPTPPPGLPTSWLVGGAAVLLVAVGAGALAARSRAQRRKMRGQTRSQALREVELEERAEKRPEEAAVIREELRAQEKVKEKRRDLQILEAKRADVLKTMDLLKKRHEAGGLTKLQYDNMVAKKQVDLQRIEAEIAQMEAEDAGSGSAAA